MDPVIHPCDGRPELEEGNTSFRAFDTVVALRAFGPKGIVAAALGRAEQSCHGLEGLFSRTRASSDVGRLNNAESAWVEIDPRTAGVLRAAKRYCEASEGAFDITIGALTELWDFKEGRVPTEEALREALATVDHHGVEVHARCGGNWFVRLSDPRARLDLGGIAKGWMADELVRSLKQEGMTGAVVSLGGDVAVSGERPDGDPWRVGIAPQGASDGSVPYATIVELAAGAVATSGITERCFEQDGGSYHHILDPKTGLPIDAEFPAVAVTAARAIDAEGFSTTLLALGLERSRALALRHPEILQARFLREDGTFVLLRP